MLKAVWHVLRFFKQLCYHASSHSDVVGLQLVTPAETMPHRGLTAGDPA